MPLSYIQSVSDLNDLTLSQRDKISVEFRIQLLHMVLTQVKCFNVIMNANNILDGDFERDAIADGLNAWYVQLSLEWMLLPTCGLAATDM